MLMKTNEGDQRCEAKPTMCRKTSKLWIVAHDVDEKIYLSIFDLTEVAQRTWETIDCCCENDTVRRHRSRPS